MYPLVGQSGDGELGGSGWAGGPGGHTPGVQAGPLGM